MKSLVTAVVLLGWPLLSAAQDSTVVPDSSADQPTTAVSDSTNPFSRAVYPSEGQSAEQQNVDQSECYKWASDHTGWDPHVSYAKLEAEYGDALSQYEQTQGAAVRGAAKGALLGVAIGAVAGDAGKGAAIGAASGAGAGGIRGRRARKATEAHFEEAVDEFKASAVKWDSQWTACMDGRNYSVE